MINLLTGTSSIQAALPLKYGTTITDLRLEYPEAIDTITIMGHERNLSRQSISDNPDAARRQLIDAGQQFEAFFISYLLKIMRETVPQGAIANKQGAYFHSFYDQEIGIRAAESGGIGITQMVQEYAEKYFSPPPVQPSSSTRWEPIKDSTG